MKWKHTSPLFPELTDVSGVKQQFQVRGRHGVCVLCLLGSLITPKNACPAKPSTRGYTQHYARSLHTVAHSCGSVLLLKLKSWGRRQLQGQQCLAFTVKPRVSGYRLSLSLEDPAGTP